MEATYNKLNTTEINYILKIKNKSDIWDNMSSKILNIDELMNSSKKTRKSRRHYYVNISIKTQKEYNKLIYFLKDNIV